MGQALKSPLRIPALDHGIAESVDDLVVGTDDSRIAAKSLDQCWLVVDAKLAVEPSLHRFSRSQLPKGFKALLEHCGHRAVQYLNNVLEQDHRAIKRRVRASQHFRSFWAAWRTIAGYEAIHMIRKGQACWSAAGAKVGLLHRFILGLFAATS